MGWQSGVLTTPPDLSVEWLRGGSNRRRSRVDMVGKLTQVVTDSADVLGSRFDLQRPPHVVVRDTVRHHLNMLGRYFLQLPGLPGGLRPLREPEADELGGRRPASPG
jgi:hypothetical protein